MKKTFILLIIVVFASFTSCTKDDAKNNFTKEQVIGTWVITKATDNKNTPDIDMSVGGTLTFYDYGVCTLKDTPGFVAERTWELHGNNIICTKENQKITYKIISLSYTNAVFEKTFNNSDYVVTLELRKEK